MFFVKDMAAFDLIVGGGNMMVGADLLQSCTVIENTHMLVPSVSMTFVDDKKRAMSFGAFADSSPMEIMVGDGKGAQNTYKFRTFSIEQGTSNSAGNVISVNGVADIMPWFRKTVDKNYNMPASEAVAQIAREAGMLADTASTNDKMNWLPDNRALSQFARKIIDHAWMGEGSSPFMAVTSQAGAWQVRVQDLMKTSPKGKRLVSMGLHTPSDIMILDYKIVSKAGAANARVNYGHKVIQEKLDGTVNIIEKMTFAKGVSALGINSDVAGAIKSALLKYMPSEVGNTHENYAKARHHNTKARATYVTTVYVTTAELSNLKLMDDVKIVLAMSDGTVDAAYSGTYKISAISRHISKGAFVEKLELTNQGTGVDVFGKGM